MIGTVSILMKTDQQGVGEQKILKSLIRKTFLLIKLKKKKKKKKKCRGLEKRKKSNIACFLVISED